MNRLFIFNLVFIVFIPGLLYSQDSFEVLMDSSDFYYDTDKARSFDYLQQAYGLLQTENDGAPTAAEATLLNNLGLLAWDMKDISNAKKLFVQSYEVYNKIGETSSEEYLNAMINLANLSKSMGDFRLAKATYQEVSELTLKLYGEFSLGYIKSMHDLAAFHEDIGELETAASQFEMAHHLIETYHPDNAYEKANSLSDLGRVYIKMGQPDKALTFIEHSDKIYADNKLTDKIEYLENLEHMGIVFEYLGKYGESERVLLKTLDLKRKKRGIDPGLILETLNDLGILYIDLGNYEKAGQYLEEAYSLSSDIYGNQHPNYATAANNLASFYNQNNQLDRALELFRESSKIYKDNYGEFYPKYATTLNNMAGICRVQKKYEESKKLYQEALRIDKVVLGEDHPEYATLLNNMAVLYSNTGDHSNAELLYTKALQLRKNSLGVNHPSYARSLENMALYYISHDQPRKSEQFFKDAIKIQVGQVNKIFPALSEIEREVFYNTVREDVERFNTVALKLMIESPGIIGDLYDNQLSTKAIIFYASDKVRRNIYSSGDDALISNYVLWKTLKARLAKFYQVGSTKLKEMNIDITELETRINSLEKSLSYQSGDFQASEEKEYSWTDIRRNLKENEAAVEIIRFREFKSLYGDDDALVYGFSDHIQYLALIIKPDSYANPELVLLDNGNQLEKQYYSAFSNAQKFGVPDDESYEQFWRKIQDKLTGVKKVYFSPDGVYNKINPEALYIPKEKKYVADLLDVNFVTSTKDIVEFNNQVVNEQRRAVLFGNPEYGTVPTELASKRGEADFISMFQPLPGTMAEITNINTMLGASGWQTYVKTQKAAKEEDLKAVSSPRVLHISTHGYFLETPPFVSKDVNATASNPLFKSGLVLADANIFLKNQMQGNQTDLESDDGMLSAYEAMNLNLDQTDLVVLSACETGLGEIMNGEGVYGLQRAFKVAGAKNLILSLNKVDDEVTKDLMVLFYKYYLETDNIRDSFRKAQLDIRQKHDNPYYWGSFILVGKG